MEQTVAPTSLTDVISVSGQIDVSDAAGIAASGVISVINHRPDDEEPHQPAAAGVAAAFAAHGVAFTHIPVRGYPSVEAAVATAEAIAVSRGKVLLFCRSGMRSTVTWALGRRMAGDDADGLRTAARRAGHDLSSVPL